MKKRLKKIFGGVLLLVCSVLLLKNMNAYAASADLIEDYELGEVYSGHINGTYGTASEVYGERYFKFNITEKSHVILWCWYKDRGYGGTIYNSNGKAMLKAQDLEFAKNEATGWSSAVQYRVLSSGTYYLKIDDNGSWGIQSFDFKFKIQAEPQIKLTKGSIASLKSAKKGQVTVNCRLVKNAIGYRIQYSTDYRLKRGVKTIYSDTKLRTLKGLKKGKRYYVRVAPYTIYGDGTLVCGQNSYVKTVKVRK